MLPPLLTRTNLAAFRDSFGPLRAEAPPREPVRGLGGQRLRASQDRPGTVTGAAASLLAPYSPAEQWRDLDLDARTLDRVSAVDLIELLADVSPDVSRALWDFLRICNPGHTAEVLRPSGSLAPRAAQLALDGIIATMSRQHGDRSAMVGKLFTSAFLRGGIAAELILDSAGRQTLGLGIPDPAGLRWRQRPDPDLGVVWEMGQWQSGKWVDLNRPTIGYVPIDPLPGRPDGRSPANPAIFPTLFALAMLHDVRRVIQQQGWPRLDLEVDLEALAGAVPNNAQPGSEQYQTWLQRVIDEVSTFYADLEPDDAYVHTSVVKVNRPIGAADATSLGAVPALIQVLERQAVRALKTAPLLMGITDGVSEANANRQVDLYLMSVRSMQHLVENLLERLLTLALQAQGVAGVVRWRFAEAQGLQRLRDAQVSEIETRVAREQYAAGWIGQDEAARRGAGVEVADLPEPRASIGPVAPAVPIAAPVDAPEENPAP